MHLPDSLHNATRLRVVDKREPNVTGSHFSHELRFDAGDGEPVLIARPGVSLISGSSWSFYEPSGRCLFSTRRHTRWLLLNQLTVSDSAGAPIATLSQRVSLQAHFEVRDASMRPRFTWSQTADDTRYEATDQQRRVAEVRFDQPGSSVTPAREAISIDACELNFPAPALDEVEWIAVLGGVVFLYVGFFRVGRW